MEQLELGFALRSTHFPVLLPGDLYKVIQTREYAFDVETYRERRLHPPFPVQHFCTLSFQPVSLGLSSNGDKIVCGITVGL